MDYKHPFHNFTILHQIRQLVVLLFIKTTCMYSFTNSITKLVAVGKWRLFMTLIMTRNFTLIILVNRARLTYYCIIFYRQHVQEHKYIVQN